MKHQKRNTEVTNNFDKNQKTIEKSELINGLKKTITSLLAGIIASQTLNAKNTDNHTQRHDKKMYDSEYITPTQESGDKKDDTIFNAQSAINNNLNKESGEKPPEDMEGSNDSLKYYKNIASVHEYMNNKLGINDNLEIRNKTDLFIAEMTLRLTFNKIKVENHIIFDAFVIIYAKKLGLKYEQSVAIKNNNPETENISFKMRKIKKSIKSATKEDPTLQSKFENNIKLGNILDDIVIN